MRGWGKDPGSGSATGRRVAAYTIVLAIALAAHVRATTIIVPTDEQLIDRSPVIAVGTIVGSSPVVTASAIYTESRLRVDRLIRGEAGGEIVIRELGGRSMERATISFGQPSYTPGERVLVFLSPSSDGTFTTTDLVVGKFVERVTLSGERVWHRPASAAGTRLIDAASENLQRRAEAFEGYVAARVHGVPGARDYMIASPRYARQVESNFALLGAPQYSRWFAFDEGRPVSWVTFGAQRGFEEGGARELQTAIQQWNGAPEAKIRLSYDGSAPVSSGIKSFDGVNAVVFNDAFDEIEGSWNGSSGIVGRASYNAVRRSGAWVAPFDADGSHPAGAISEIWEIVEGNIVIQDGVAPFNNIGSAKLAQIIAHEIGHTLGLAHSPDSDALMASTIDGSGPHLRADDQLGARWLYPASGSQNLAGGSLVADFGLSTEHPRAGAAVELLDRSSGEPTAWHWDFGNGATSNDRNPVHAYAAPGVYTVSLTATRGGISSTRTKLVHVASDLPRTGAVVPVIASTGGIGSTSWHTELTLFNEGTSDLFIALRHLPSSGSSPLEQRLTIRAGQTISYADALPEIFSVTGTAGALRIEASTAEGETPRLRVASRTYTTSENGTYGQSVPATGELPRVLYVAGIASNGAFRTNLGFANDTLNPVEALLTLKDAAGTVRGTATLRLAGQSFHQAPLTTLFPEMAGTEEDALSLTIESDRGEALTGYASVIDNRSQDPVLIPARPAREGALLLPGAAHTPGAAGTFWRTDLALFNPRETASEVTVGVLGREGARTLQLLPGSTLLVRDALAWVDATAATGTLVIRAATDGAAPMVSARTYTARTDGGTFGQWVPAVAMDALPSETSLTGIRVDATYRTNVGLVNPGSQPSTVTVDLFSGDGFVETTAVEVAAAGSLQLPVAALFPSLAAGTEGAQSIRFRSSGPGVVAFASVVDNRTGDSTFLAND